MCSKSSETTKKSISGRGSKLEEEACLEKILTSGKSIYLFLISCGIELDEICLKFGRNLRNWKKLCGNSAEIDEILRETYPIP